MTEIRLLGPVEVWVDGAEVDVGPAKPRLVLAALAVAPGRVVPLEVIADRIWGDRPPGRPAATLYPYLSQLRRALAPAGIGITRRSGGYLLDTAEANVDAVRFAQGLTKARAGAVTTAELRETIGLWRGVPLAGLDGSWATSYRTSLTNDRLSAWLLLAERADSSGGLAELADDLLLVAGDHPLSEPMAGFVIRALVQAGRRAEALRHYADLRGRLIDELGEEPSKELRALHLRLLRRESDASPRAGIVPRQLPSSLRYLAGRSAELKLLDQLLDPQTVAVAVIAGTAGVGKSSLALHWANGVADRFVDGQVFLDLHGFAPTGVPVPPAEAIRSCLHALGVAPEAVPDGLAARVALLRSLTTERRLLIVLDNARDVEQVRHLIPAGPGSVVLVTSRSRLTGLVATFGAHSIMLDLLSPEDAETLLADRVGPDRLAAEPAAAATIARQCSYLPLALSVVAAETAQAPDLPLAALARQLDDSGQRLDRLDTADPSTSVRAVLSWSYQAQQAPVRRMFRLLALHPGPDISAPAVASLVGADQTDATRALRRLCQSSLLTQPAPDRFSYHDLLRAYAAETSAAEDSEADRDAALRRVLDHYVRTAYLAIGLLNPGRDELDLGPPDPAVRPEALADVGAALAWFGSELAVLVRSVELAAATGHDGYCWQLADLTARYLGRQGRWRDAVALEQVGLDAAHRINDLAALAMTHRGVAYFCVRTGQYAESRDHLRRAFGLYRSIGDRRGLAYALEIAGFLAAQRHDFESARAYVENARELFTAEGHRLGQLRTLGSIGWYLAQLGEVDGAITSTRQVLALAEELGDVKSEAAAHDTLGYLNRRRGQHDEAIRCYQKAVQLFGAIDDKFYLATALQSLGDVHADLADTPAAREVWADALRILAELDHPGATSLRAKLGASA